jgi:hypothetical protein
MGRHEFMLKLNRQITADEVDVLYEVGCGDAGVETGALGALIDFSREASTLAEALVSAVRDVEKVPGLRAVGVACENMVDLAGIADRAGVTREAVRLWAAGLRGSGDFPEPLAVAASGEKFWDWEQAARWIREHRGPAHAQIWAPDVRVRTLCTANRVLVARDALRSEPDDAVREEFERLLEDA